MKKFNFEELFVLVGGLQSHTEGGAGGGAGGEGDTNSGAGEGDKGGQDDKGGDDKPKAFKGSQDDVNNMISKASKQAIEKVLKDLGVEDVKDAKSAMAEYKKIQDANKTDNQKLIDDYEALTTSSTENNKLLAGYKARDIAFEKGVLDPKNQAKLVKLASVSEEEDMGKAMDALLLEYPMFKGEEKPGQFGTDSSGKGKGGAVDEKRAAVRKAAGLK